MLHAPRFADLAPATVYATLLDEGIYHCSERTMSRVLAAQNEVRERRAQRQHPVYAAPELLATAPNQLWSCGFSKFCRGVSLQELGHHAAQGTGEVDYFSLDVLLDVCGRYIVGWLVAPRESATLAERLLAMSCERQRSLPEQLTIHADRGAPMTSKPVAFLLADLGVTKTHSRRTSRPTIRTPRRTSRR